LAAEPAKTAVATIMWSTGRATVERLALGVEDGALVSAVVGADKAGIDCPLGWPNAFVDFVTAHHTGHVVAPEDVAGRAWRRRLAWRVTDEAVHDATGLNPLSVSADRIGHTAMRGAAILARLDGLGRAVDRCGDGVVEVYPAASLRHWDLPYKRYKGRENLAVLCQLVDQMLEAAPWLDLRAYERDCRASDDAFDAVVAALTARAAALDLVAPPSSAQREAARTEGWIAVPTVKLTELR